MEIYKPWHHRAMGMWRGSGGWRGRQRRESFTVAIDRGDLEAFDPTEVCRNLEI